MDSTPPIRYTSGYMHTVAGMTEHELDYCIHYISHVITQVIRAERVGALVGEYGIHVFHLSPRRGRALDVVPERP